MFLKTTIEATTITASTAIIVLPMGIKGQRRCSSRLTISVPPVVEPRRNTSATAMPMHTPPNNAARILSPA